MSSPCGPLTPIAGLCRHLTVELRGLIFSTTSAQPSPIGARWSRPTPSQPRTYEFLKLWHYHVGADTGGSPFIVVAFNATGTPLFLRPFSTRKVAGLRLAEFLGGKHANFNMALWRRDIAATIGVDPCVPCSHA
jgi:CelD/BcsL family acetyltransferase involved in cellulose biosynthesis